MSALQTQKQRIILLLAHTKNSLLTYVEGSNFFPASFTVLLLFSSFFSVVSKVAHHIIFYILYLTYSKKPNHDENKFCSNK